MNYRLLGASGLRVSELCLGTMTFGEEWGWGANKEESRKIFDLYTDRGGNFLDTANRYTDGTSEKYVGEFIKGSREQFVVATKYTLFTDPDDPNAAGNHRKNMMQAVNASLRRLETEYIDLYWVHAWDFLTPAEEVMRGLDDLVRSGKVLYIGVSDTPAWVVSRANMLAELRGWSRFVGLQIEYSLAERTVERELIPMARTLDLAVAAWAPLAAGVLSAKYLDGRKPEEASRLAAESDRLSERNLAIARVVKSVADEIDVTPSQVAVNWLRQQPGVVIPIIGARRAWQVEENLGALEFEIPEAQMVRLEEGSRIPLGFPHDFLMKENIREMVRGPKHPKIRAHRDYTA